MTSTDRAKEGNIGIGESSRGDRRRNQHGSSHSSADRPGPDQGPAAALTFAVSRQDKESMTEARWRLAGRPILKSYRSTRLSGARIFNVR